MLEHHREPLQTRKEFVFRQIRYFAFALLILLVSLGIGTVGYHVFANIKWLDAFLNASMILTGMGP